MGEVFLTVRGLLKYHATKRYVTVDMGAVRFVCNGADVMTPGIIGFDASIKEGDLVWIRDARNLQPLAVGRALLGADRMVLKEKGKAVTSIHYVGDRLWQLDEPKEKETIEQPLTADRPARQDGE
jgi:PUA domain protein